MTYRIYLQVVPLHKFSLAVLLCKKWNVPNLECDAIEFAEFGKCLFGICSIWNRYAQFGMCSIWQLLNFKNDFNPLSTACHARLPGLQNGISDTLSLGLHIIEEFHC